MLGQITVSLPTPRSISITCALCHHLADAFHVFCDSRFLDELREQIDPFEDHLITEHGLTHAQVRTAVIIGAALVVPPNDSEPQRILAIVSMG